MKLEKQNFVIEIMANGKYRMDSEAGKLYGYRKGKDVWVEVRPNVLPKGYLQYTIFPGRGKGKGCVVYGHVLNWLVTNGVYAEGMVIHHKDSDTLNNGIGNLELTTQKINIEHSLKNRPVSNGKSRVIRGPELEKIRKFHSEGFSQSEIARTMDLGRLAVGYHVRNIIAGKTEFRKAHLPSVVKYENLKIEDDE